MFELNLNQWALFIHLTISDDPLLKVRTVTITLFCFQWTIFIV